MAMKMKTGMLVFALFSFNAFGLESEIQFTNRELDAAFVLVRPELNKITINQRTGVFDPAPALQFFGLTQKKFEISFGTIPALAGIQFNQLKSKTPMIEFDDGALKITVPVEDQESVMTSRLGSVSFKNVKLVISLEWVPLSSGSQRLNVKSAWVEGSMYGTGLLKPNFILSQVRKILSNLAYQEANDLLNKEPVQESVLMGLLQWSKFYSGVEAHALVPGSIKFFRTEKNSALSGISFQVIQ